MAREKRSQALSAWVPISQDNSLYGWACRLVGSPDSLSTFDRDLTAWGTASQQERWQCQAGMGCTRLSLEGTASGQQWYPAR